MESGDRATRAAKVRYGRIAPVYDLLEAIPEQQYRSWRERFWREVAEEISPTARLLEVGVGTGKNIPFWPQADRITAIDFAPGMVKRARRRAEEEGREGEILEGDVQSLDFPTDAFDAAAATFVFCSVPDPQRGLSELARVVKPGGHIFLLEHVRATNPLLGTLMDLVNPIMRSLMGPNINRDTVGNVKTSVLQIESVEDLDRLGIFKRISAQNPET